MKNLKLPIQYVPCKKVELRTETQGDKQTELIRVYASDETPIARFSWEEWDEYWLIFSHDPNHVRLSRVENGVCLFFQGHPGMFSNSDRIGKAKKAIIEDNHLELSIKLGSNEPALKYKQDLDDDIAPGISIGAQVYTVEVIQEAKFDRKGVKTQDLIVKAIDWELVEVSAVDIPANPNARVLSANEMMFQCNVIGNTGFEGMTKPKPNQPTEEPKTVEVESTAAQDPELLEAHRKSKIEAHYWKLRSTALNLLYDNRITESDFQVDFSDKPEDDIAKLTAMEPLDSKAEFRVIERSLQKCQRPPEQRPGLSESDRVLLGNETIQKPIENKNPGTIPTPDGSSVDDYADSITQELLN